MSHQRQGLSANVSSDSQVLHSAPFARGLKDVHMTLTSGQFRTTNAILAGLPPEEFSRLRPLLTRMRLVPDQRLIESGQATEHVFFIEEGIASLMAETEDGSPGVQVAMIGREGLVGGLALLGGSASYGCTVVQVPGPALRITVANLLRCFEACPALRGACLQYVQALTRQVMSNAVSNVRHTLAERCVRWLLMAHDRMEEDDLPVTHEALSAMLGVRRSGVTVATTALQGAGLIRTRRGHIRVLDRPGLEAVVSGRTSQRCTGDGSTPAADGAGIAMEAGT
jgi:CRP-like cAMP-binding protein